MSSDYSSENMDYSSISSPYYAQSRTPTPAVSSNLHHSRHSSMDMSDGDYKQWARSIPLHSEVDESESMPPSSPTPFERPATHMIPRHSRVASRSFTPDSSSNPLRREVEQLRRESENLSWQVATLQRQKLVVEGKLETMTNAFTSVTSALPGLLHIANPLKQVLSSGSEPLRRDAAPFVVAPLGQSELEVPLPTGKYLGAEKEDFSKVRFWTREAYNDHEKSMKVTGNTASHYLEDEEGQPLSKALLKEVGAHSKRLLMQMFRNKVIPLTWGVTDARSRDFYLISMENHISELRLCHNHWKADLFATKSYSSIRDNHAAKVDPSFAKPIKQEPSTETKLEENKANKRKAPADISKLTKRSKASTLEFQPLGAVQLLTKHQIPQTTGEIVSTSATSPPSPPPSTETTQEVTTLAPAAAAVSGQTTASENVASRSAAPVAATTTVPAVAMNALENGAVEADKPTLPPLAPSADSGANHPPRFKIQRTLGKDRPSALEASQMAEMLEKAPAEVPPISTPSNENSGSRSPISPSAGVNGLETMTRNTTEDEPGTKINAIGNPIAAAAAVPPNAPVSASKKAFTPSANSFTPRNICALKWCETNPHGTASEFAGYWNSIKDTPVVEQFKQASEEKKVATPTVRVKPNTRRR